MFILNYFTQTQLPNPAVQAPASSGDSGVILGWLASALLVAAVVALVIKPLLKAESSSGRPRPAASLTNPAMHSRLEGLQEQANAERQAISDLEFDRELGIIEEKDYAELKERSSGKLESLNYEIGLLQSRLGGASRVSAARSAPAVSSEANAGRRDYTAVSTEEATPARQKTGEIHLKNIIKEKLKCAECGTPGKPGDRFCAKCTAPLPLLCLNCGKEITEDDRFCSKCGAAVNT